MFVGLDVYKKHAKVLSSMKRAGKKQERIQNEPELIEDLRLIVN